MIARAPESACRRGRTRGSLAWALSLALAFGAALWSEARADSSTSHPMVNTVLQTTSSGNRAWAYLSTDSQDYRGHALTPIPARPTTANCLWSRWHLLGEHNHGWRYYAVYVMDECRGGISLPGHGECLNDDGRAKSEMPADCVDIPPRELIAGIPPSQCDANAIATEALQASLTPASYDPHQGATLTATTAFTSDAIDRISEGSCTNVLTWQVTRWTLLWSDGATTTVAGSGHDGVNVTHTLAGRSDATSSTESGVVSVIARLHIHGDALDFDDNGRFETVARDADVDVRTSVGSAVGNAPVDVPPQLQVGALAVGQLGDGTIPTDIPTTAPSDHANSIRGRLLLLYARPLVVTAGVEMVNGARVGTAASVVTSWTYLGDPTDAPTREGTAPGDTGPPTQPVAVQWNHAERLDASGYPVDETVPLRLTVRTTYPDGNVRQDVVVGDVKVTLWYVASNAPD